MNKQSGFTLIESLLYIALFTIIIGGGMLAAYQIIQSADASYNHVILQQEANFLFRKMSWALNTDPNHLTFNVQNGDLALQRGTATPVILNASSITVSNWSFSKNTINFTLTADQNGRPASQDFSFTKYPRK